MIEVHVTRVNDHVFTYVFEVALLEESHKGFLVVHVKRGPYRFVQRYTVFLEHLAQDCHHVGVGAAAPNAASNTATVLQHAVSFLKHTLSSFGEM
jgi:hypothetical protein